MALDVTPVTWLGAGYALTSSDTGEAPNVVSVRKISFTIDGDTTVEALPQVDATEANATTGDVRRLIFGIIDGLYAKWLIRVAAAAAAPTTDPLPTKMTIYKSTSTNDSTGEVTRTYTFQFKTTVTGEEVAEEA